MGSCFSKHANEKLDNTTTVTGKSRFQSTEKRLGDSSQSQSVPSTGAKAASVSKKLGSENKTSSATQSQGLAVKANGNKLGDSSATENLSVREAAAKAAEERFSKKKEELSSSKNRLKTMSKMSKSDKGL